MKSRWIPLAVTLGAIAVLLLVIAAIIHAVSHHDIVTPAPETVIYPKVRVVVASPDHYQARVTAYGEVTAHHSLDLTTEVSGTVASIAPTFESGATITANTVIATLDDTSYRSALATARATLASAQVSLLEEEREGRQAAAEWQRAGLDGDPDSDLVLRGPQLAAARTAVEDAKTAVAVAERNLALTRIRAPFDAIVVSRTISPGSYLAAGTSVATLNSSDRVEVRLPLAAEQWQQLPAEKALLGETVTLTDTAASQQWVAQVQRVEHHLDSSSRQRYLVAAVQAPMTLDTPLLPGTFVTASITGVALDHLLKVPASALSDSGVIWYVDASNQLQSFTAHSRFARDNDLYIDAPDGDGPWSIVITPLANYLPQMNVVPVTEQTP